jgi:hypothetical protein
MKNIDITQISDPLIQQPFTGLSLQFLQNASKEMVQVICRNIVTSHGLVYSATTPYLLSSFATTFTSDGAVFYGDELYIMLENFSTLNYAVIDTTPDATADPVIFTDSISRSVHNNRYLTFTNTLSGSLFPVANIVDLRLNPVFINITPATNWTVPTPYITSTNVFQYRKNVNNEIEFRGFVKNTDTGATVTIFTLPVGSRPVNDKAFVIWASGAPGGSVYSVELIIYANGSVNAYVQGLANNTIVSLSNIRFSLD